MHSGHLIIQKIDTHLILKTKYGGMAYEFKSKSLIYINKTRLLFVRLSTKGLNTKETGEKSVLTI